MVEKTNVPIEHFHALHPELDTDHTHSANGFFTCFRTHTQIHTIIMKVKGEYMSFQKATT